MRKGLSLVTLMLYIVGLISVLFIITAFNANTLQPSYEYVRTAKLNEYYQQLNSFFLNAINKPECNYAQLSDSDRTIELYQRTQIPTIDPETLEVTGYTYDDVFLCEFRYDSTHKTLIYDDGANELVICKYLESIQYSLGTVTMEDTTEKITVDIDLQFKINNTAFTPLIDIGYVLGRGY